MRRTFVALLGIAIIAVSAYVGVQHFSPNSRSQAAATTICEADGGCREVQSGAFVQIQDSAGVWQPVDDGQGGTNYYSVSDPFSYPSEEDNMSFDEIYAVVLLTIAGLFLLVGVPLIIWTSVADSRDRKKYELWHSSETEAAKKDLEVFGLTLQGDDEVDVEDSTLWLDCGVGGVELALYKVDDRWQVFRTWPNGERLLVPVAVLLKLREGTTGISNEFDLELRSKTS